jgi:hypothetical protein
MTADERAAALLRHLSGLTWAEYDRRAPAVVAAAIRAAEAAAAAAVTAAVTAAGRERPGAGGAAMTVTTERRLRAWVKCAAGDVTSSLNDELFHVVDSAIREAGAVAASGQREADAALVVRLGKNPGFWDSWPERVAAEILAGGGGGE